MVSEEAHPFTARRSMCTAIKGFAEIKRQRNSLDSEMSIVDANGCPIVRLECILESPFIGECIKCSEISNFFRKSFHTYEQLSTSLPARSIGKSNLDRAQNESTNAFEVVEMGKRVRAFKQRKIIG